MDGVYELNVGARRLRVFCDFKHAGGNWAVSNQYFSIQFVHEFKHFK